MIVNYTKPAKDCIVNNDGEEITKVHHANRDPRMPDNHDPEKEYQKSDYRDNLTLDEVAENDQEMHKEAIKNARRYFFKNAWSAQAFVGKCIEVTLKRLGCVVIQGMPAGRLQGLMDEKKIQIENRNGMYSFDNDDFWRNGLYIFKAGELVAFISVPMQRAPGKFDIDQKTGIFVITNAKYDMKGFH